jgi:hypothetical protein
MPKPFCDFHLPLQLSVWAPSLYAPAQGFQFWAVVGLVHPLDEIRLHLHRPTRS